LLVVFTSKNLMSSPVGYDECLVDSCQFSWFWITINKFDFSKKCIVVQSHILKS